MMTQLNRTALERRERKRFSLSFGKSVRRAVLSHRSWLNRRLSQKTKKMNGQHSTGNGISHFRYWYQYWGMGRPLPVLVNCALGTYVRGNMDSIVICILRHAICILQKFLGDIDTSSKPFLFRRKESILHLDPYCRAIWILFFNHW